MSENAKHAFKFKLKIKIKIKTKDDFFRLISIR